MGAGVGALPATATATSSDLNILERRDPMLATSGQGEIWSLALTAPNANKIRKREREGEYGVYCHLVKTTVKISDRVPQQQIRS